MKSIKKIILGAIGGFSLLTFTQANAHIIISKIDPSGSGTSTYAAAFPSPTAEVGSLGSVPEPSACALMMGGLITLVGFQAWRRNKVA